VDTSIWVASLRDEERADHAWKRIANRPVHVSTVVLAELRSLEVQGRAPADAVAQVLAMARAHPVDEAIAASAGEVHGRLRKRGRSRASLADAISLQTARNLGGTYITFDQDLEGEPDVEVL